MKTLKGLVLASVLSGALLTSCNKDITRSETLSDAVNFSTSINHPATKAVNDAWNSNDLIGIYMKKASEPLSAASALAENMKYVTSTGDGFFTPSATDQAIYFPVDNSPVDFIAYYPFRTAPTDYTIPVDVSNQTSQADIDLMYSNDAVNKNASDANVELDFNHVLAKLVLNIANQSGASLDGLSVTITGMRTGASFNLVDGSLTDAIYSVADIVAKTVVTHSTAVSEAIVLPAEALNGGKIVFNLGGKFYIWNIPADQEYAGGTKYTYNFTLKAAVIELNGSATIQDWAEGPAEDIELGGDISGSISVSDIEMAFPATGGDLSISVTASSEYTVIIPPSAGWLTVKAQDQTSFTLSASAENSDLMIRSAVVTLQLVADTTKSADIMVTQEVQIPSTNGMGTGWSLYSPTKSIHLSQSLGNSSTTLYTYSWNSFQLMQANGIETPVAHYKYTAENNEEEFYFYRTGTNRSEIRLNNNYTAGTRQFEGYVNFDLNTNDECLMQIFGSNDAGNATLLMIRGFNVNDGELRISTSTVIATGAHPRWYRINVIHVEPVLSGDTVTTPGRVVVYIDGEKRYEKPHATAPKTTDPNYFKYGCYGTVNSGTVPARVRWRNVQVFQNGLPPQE